MLSDSGEQCEGSSTELNNRSLDWDRHISTQRPTREVLLRAVRGEDSDNDLGESFAIDDYHPVQPPRMGRGESNLVPVPDADFSESQTDTDTDQNETSEPTLVSEAAEEDEEEG